MEKFLERHKNPKLTEEMDKLHSSISVKEVEIIVKNITTKKTVASDGFTGKFKT